MAKAYVIMKSTKDNQPSSTLPLCSTEHWKRAKVIRVSLLHLIRSVRSPLNGEQMLQDDNAPLMQSCQQESIKNETGRHWPRSFVIDKPAVIKFFIPKSWKTHLWSVRGKLKVQVGGLSES